MIQIRCRTNLDIEPGEIWPECLPEVPRVGDNIQSGLTWRNGARLELRVCAITWKHSSRTLGYGGQDNKWTAEVEMHLPPHRFASIRCFELWYEHIQGKLCDESYRSLMDKAMTAASH